MITVKEAEQAATIGELTEPIAKSLAAKRTTPLTSVEKAEVELASAAFPLETLFEVFNSLLSGASVEAADLAGRMVLARVHRVLEQWLMVADRATLARVAQDRDSALAGVAAERLKKLGLAIAA